MYNDIKSAIKAVWELGTSEGFVVVAAVVLVVGGFVYGFISSINEEDAIKNHCIERGLQYVRGTGCAIVLTEAEIGLFFEDY